MNPNRFFIPNMGINQMMNMGANNSLFGSNYFVSRTGIFSKIFNGIKSFNWSGLLNGANKTLNVVNQTIPLIKQTKPMVNNVRNMIGLAKAFRKETKNDDYKNLNKSMSSNLEKKEVIDNNYPNFFI